MLQEHNGEGMPRALLTDGERDAIRDDAEMTDTTRASHLSRVRSKIDRMGEDARLLKEHQPELYESLHEAVVEDELADRVERLEDEVESLRGVLNDTELTQK